MTIVGKSMYSYCWHNSAHFLTRTNNVRGSSLLKRNPCGTQWFWICSVLPASEFSLPLFLSSEMSLHILSWSLSSLSSILYTFITILPAEISISSELRTFTICGTHLVVRICFVALLFSFRSACPISPHCVWHLCTWNPCLSPRKSGARQTVTVMHMRNYRSYGR